MKDFKFYMPVEFVDVEKANKEDDSAPDSWKIQGIASTADEDLQGEVVSQEGLDISVLKAGRGLWNWDHQKGPENVLGQIEDADFVERDGKKCLLVKGYLFKYQERAKAFYNILKSVKKSNGPRVHLSIEGKILERDWRNQKSINKARIEKVALTLDPVNPYTYAELMKSLQSDEASAQEVNETKELVQIDQEDLEFLIETAEKAMCAGAGYQGAPGSMKNGEATGKESMESRIKKVTYGQKKKKIRKAMVKSLIDTVRDRFPDHDPVELAEMVTKACLKKFEGDGRG